MIWIVARSYNLTTNLAATEDTHEIVDADAVGMETPQDHIACRIAGRNRDLMNSSPRHMGGRWRGEPIELMDVPRDDVYQGKSAAASVECTHEEIRHTVQFRPC